MGEFHVFLSKVACRAKLLFTYTQLICLVRNASEWSGITVKTCEAGSIRRGRALCCEGALDAR